jgi:hypothetical protein
MRIRFSMAALMLAVSASAFAADTPPAAKLTRVRGTIESFDGKLIKLKSSDGTEVSGPLSPQVRLSAVEARTFEQLKPTDFVGITAVDGANGHLTAEEIHIIPIVGLGEGQYPWDHHPDGMSSGPVRAGSMTNGTIQAQPMRAGSMTNGTIVTGAAHQLKVTFHGEKVVDGKCVGHAPASGGCVGTALVDVTAKTYIQAIVGATVADVKAGEAVVATSATMADGSVAIVGLTVEKNGVKPEF